LQFPSFYAQGSLNFHPPIHENGTEVARNILRYRLYGKTAWKKNAFGSPVSSWRVNSKRDQVWPLLLRYWTSEGRNEICIQLVAERNISVTDILGMSFSRRKIVTVDGKYPFWCFFGLWSLRKTKMNFWKPDQNEFLKNQNEFLEKPK